MIYYLIIDNILINKLFALNSTITERKVELNLKYCKLFKIKYNRKHWFRKVILIHWYYTKYTKLKIKWLLIKIVKLNNK